LRQYFKKYSIRFFLKMPKMPISPVIPSDMLKNRSSRALPLRPAAHRKEENEKKLCYLQVLLLCCSYVNTKSVNHYNIINFCAVFSTFCALFTDSSLLFKFGLKKSRYAKDVLKRGHKPVTKKLFHSSLFPNLSSYQAPRLYGQRGGVLDFLIWQRY